MKRILFYITVLLVVWLLPSNGTDVGKLQPVEVVSLTIENNKTVISTDTNDRGIGDCVEEALQNLKDTTAGIIYLDTADYLLVSKETEEMIPQISQYLDDSVRVCFAHRAVKLEDAALFLAVHKPKMKLKEWTLGTKPQTLEVRDDRLILTE